MIINVNDEWRIFSDPANWIVQRRFKNPKPKSNGEVYEWKNIAYCVSLESAVKTMAERRIRIIESSDVSKILKKIQQIADELQAGLKPFQIDVKKAGGGVR